MVFRSEERSGVGIDKSVSIVPCARESERLLTGCQRKDASSGSSEVIQRSEKPVCYRQRGTLIAL